MIKRKESIIGVLLVLFTCSIYGQNIISGIEKQSTYFEFAADMQNYMPELNNYGSGGSIENFNKVLNDSSKIDIAFVQYDVLLYMQLLNAGVKDKLELVLQCIKKKYTLLQKKQATLIQ